LQTPKKQPWLTKLSKWAPQIKEEFHQALIEHYDDYPEYTLNIAEITESYIPKEYDKFQELFQTKEKPLLPEYGPYDHEIPILPGKEPKYMPLYQLSEKESAVLRAYINDNLKKGYIRHSNSPAGYPILYHKTTSWIMIFTIQILYSTFSTPNRKRSV
jgi:hypothetical protein